jgi:muramoyltetrapeptide carboxypeptidase
MGALTGRTIQVIAPSGSHLSLEEFDRATRWFEAHGATLICEVPREGWQRFSATDDERLAGIHRAAARTDLDAVMITRGGYGLSRLIDRIDWSLVAASSARGCRWIGFSDFTLLHLGLLAQGGASSWAGPSFSADFGASDGPDPFTLEQFEAIFSGDPPPALQWAADGENARLEIEGVLWGGNLSMICSVAGTPWCPDLSGGLLFIEDVSEHPYRIERMLHQLDHLGLLRRQAALLIGHFSDWRSAPHDRGYDLDAVIDYWRKRIDVPILTGLPFGHVPRKALLNVGRRHRLEADGQAASLIALS